MRETVLDILRMRKTVLDILRVFSFILPFVEKYRKGSHYKKSNEHTKKNLDSRSVLSQYRWGMFEQFKQPKYRGVNLPWSGHLPNTPKVGTR